MGAKYMATCSTYPYKGKADYVIQERYFIHFIIKLIKVRRKYQIIDITYRNC